MLIGASESWRHHGLGLAILPVGLLVEVILGGVQQPVQLGLAVDDEVPQRLHEPLMGEVRAWVKVVSGDSSPSSLQGGHLWQQRAAELHARSRQVAAEAIVEYVVDQRVLEAALCGG